MVVVGRRARRTHSSMARAAARSPLVVDVEAEPREHDRDVGRLDREQSRAAVARLLGRRHLGDVERREAAHLAPAGLRRGGPAAAATTRRSGLGDLAARPACGPSGSMPSRARTRGYGSHSATGVVDDPDACQSRGPGTPRCGLRAVSHGSASAGTRRSRHRSAGRRRTRTPRGSGTRSPRVSSRSRGMGPGRSRCRGRTPVVGPSSGRRALPARQVALQPRAGPLLQAEALLLLDPQLASPAVDGEPRSDLEQAFLLVERRPAGPTPHPSRAARTGAAASCPAGCRA